MAAKTNEFVKWFYQHILVFGVRSEYVYEWVCNEPLVKNGE